MRYGIFTTVVVATTLFVTTSVGVSAQVPGVAIARTERAGDVGRAVELERQAEALQGESGKWNEAAGLLRTAARLRPGNDPVALADLQMAGTIFNRTREYFRARDTMLELARRAADFGEVNAEAHALIDAAFLTARRGEAGLASQYLERAQKLANSSHLTSEQQAHLAMRLNPPER